MSILASLNKDSCGGVIGEITPFSLSFKIVDIPSKGFLLPLLYFHKMAYGHVDIRITYF